MTHAWCHDITRDAAVRAAEDGRAGPLPTLGEAIEAITNHDAPPGARVSDRQCASPADTGAYKADGLRTERVTLEVTHGESFGVSHWSWVTILRIKSGESVRVVRDEEPGRDMGNGVFVASVSEVHAMYGETVNLLTAERDAAIREREKAVAFWQGELRARTAERDAARARVAELEAASGGREQPRGWLTGEEREAVQWAADAAYDKQHPAEDTLRNILARSTPPEVVLPEPVGETKSHGPLLRKRDVIAALAAAGVEVKEVAE